MAKRKAAAATGSHVFACKNRGTGDSRIVPQAPLAMTQRPSYVKYLGLSLAQRKRRQAQQREENAERARTGVGMALEVEGYVKHELPGGALVFRSTPKMDATPDIQAMASELNSPELLNVMDKEVKKGGKVRHASLGRVPRGLTRLTNLALHADKPPPGVRRPTGR